MVFLSIAIRPLWFPVNDLHYSSIRSDTSSELQKGSPVSRMFPPTSPWLIANNMVHADQASFPQYIVHVEVLPWEQVFPEDGGFSWSKLSTKHQKPIGRDQLFLTKITPLYDLWLFFLVTSSDKQISRGKGNRGKSNK